MPIEPAIELIDRCAQIGSRLIDGRLVAQLAQQLKKHTDGTGHQLGLNGGQDTAPQNVALCLRRYQIL